jgi:hypothetical protein
MTLAGPKPAAAGPYLRTARPKVDIRRERDAAGQLTRIVISAPPGSVTPASRCLLALDRPTRASRAAHKDVDFLPSSMTSPRRAVRGPFVP